MACIEGRGLRKTYGTTIALDGVDLRIEEGRIPQIYRSLTAQGKTIKCSTPSFRPHSLIRGN